MTQNIQEAASSTPSAVTTNHSVPATVPIPEVTPFDKLGEVLSTIQSDARKAPKNFLSSLHAPYGGE